MTERSNLPGSGSAAQGPLREQRDFARSFDALDDIYAFVQSVLDARGIGTADAYAIVMTIEELFTNMVKYNAAGSGRIGLEIECGADAVTCRLTDPDSERFDVTHAPDADIHQPVEQRRPGGLGIHLIRRMVDAMDYDHAGRRSRISFRRNLGGAAPGADSAPSGSAAGMADEHALLFRRSAPARESAMFEIGYGDGGVIALTGRLDAAQCTRAQEFIDAAGAPGVFDFRALEYISSAGLGVLLRTHKRLLASGGRLRLINVNSHIHDIFRFSGFDKVFDVERAGG
jgi:anti-anti-sigma factor